MGILPSVALYFVTVIFLLKSVYSHVPFQFSSIIFLQHFLNLVFFFFFHDLYGSFLIFLVWLSSSSKPKSTKLLHLFGLILSIIGKKWMLTIQNCNLITCSLNLLNTH